MKLIVIIGLLGGFANGASITVSSGLSPQGYGVLFNGVVPENFYWSAGSWNAATSTWTQFGTTVTDTDKIDGGVSATGPSSLNGQVIDILVRIQPDIASSGRFWVVLRSNANTLFPWDVTAASNLTLQFALTNAVTIIAAGEPQLTRFTAPVGPTGGSLNLVGLSPLYRIITGGANGTVTGGGYYPAFATAKLTATPSAGYSFTGWTGNANGSVNPLSMQVYGDLLTVTANFAPDTRDTDADGLSNYDECVIFGTNPTLNDTDGDGYLDGTEVTCGSNPLAAGSDPELKLRNVSVPSPGTFQFAFPAQIGMTYSVLESTDLVHWSARETGIPGQGTVIVRSYPTTGVPNRYFRVLRN
jgi:uncharacterized repeat protein (TIGR02543 family)